MWAVPLASRGPFGPTAAGCVLLPVLLVGPFVLVPLFLRSILRAETTSWWLLAPMTALAGWLGVLLWPWHEIPETRSAFWGMWWLGVHLSLLLAPVSLVREIAKRGWLRRRR